MEALNSVVVVVNDLIWTYVLIAMLLIVGLMFTLKSKFVQFKYVDEMVRLLGDGIGKKTKGVSSFGAFCISVASRVGTGNLAGVATALAIGGAGAVFWMWLIAIIGSASSFAESTLAQLYKRRQDDGTYVGGPAYYMETGLGKRWMGVLFAIIISITFGLFFNSVQSNTIALAFSPWLGGNTTAIGIALAILTLAVVFGGVKRIAFISSVLVPIMAVGYILVALFVVFSNIGMFGEVITHIFESAFGLREAVAGGVGAAVMQGVRRGLFSNEAGMGSAPNAAATAEVTHPAKQGLIQTLGVFTDTLVVCSCTAFIILSSGAPLDGSISGIELTQKAMDNMLGEGFGGTFIAICILMFAFSSIIGNYYYGESNIKFITSDKKWLNLYRLMVGAMIFFGAIASLNLVWNLADVSMAFMAIINLIAIFLLRDSAIEVLNDYRKQKKAGIKSPQYKNDKFEVWK
ncbi:MAG: alanine/glycine:cation symporter family protein [Rikenellaceae bacterium]